MNGTEWIAVCGVLATLVAALIGVAVTIWGNRDVTKIKHQVVNGHTSNLRDEVDRLLDDIREMRRDIGGMREDIGGLRGELRDEREARIESDRAVITELRKPAV